jgi:hypothetical protein
MATVEVNGSTLGTSLQALLLADEIAPGSAPSYQLCKTIYSFHPLGAKIVEAPIAAAQSQSRKIAVGEAPEEVVKAFVDQWLKDGADGHIANVAATARMYGIASLAVLTDGVEPTIPLDYATLWKTKIGFNVLDPLNTAGSLVLNQDPNSIDFQKHAAIAVAGKPYARNRSVTILNEKPLYIEYTQSGFGFVGRSVYQRVLFPLKSFVQTMVTDDMVSRKAGLLIAMIKGAGSIVDNMMAAFAGIKRSLLKVGVVDNVLSVGPDDKIESLNLQNLEGPTGQARTNILKNIATGAKMPAVMLENETLTEGFGEGTEDAKVIAQFVDGTREWLSPLYAFFEPIVQRRAWNPEFYEIVKAKYPEAYAGKTFEVAYGEWVAAYTATWPNLLEEPESEKIKVEAVKFETILSTITTVAPLLDPENKASLISWAIDNLNENKLLFGTPLVLDLDALAAWNEERQDLEDAPEPGDGEKITGKTGASVSGGSPGARADTSHLKRAIAGLPVRFERKVGT